MNRKSIRLVSGKVRREDQGNIPAKEVLTKLKLVKEDKLTNAGVLLFGKEPQRFFTQSEVSNRARITCTFKEASLETTSAQLVSPQNSQSLCSLCPLWFNPGNNLKNIS